MSPETQQHIDAKMIIVLDHSQHKTAFDHIGSDHGWRLNRCQTLDEAIEMQSQSGAHGVLFKADPLCADNTSTLEELANRLKSEGVFIMTYASFNPSWIENLMHQNGSDHHFRHQPSVAELAVTMNMFTQHKASA